MDSVPRVDHDDQEWFASRHRGHLNQKARLHWEDEAKGRVLYLSWRNLSWIWDDLVSTIHIVRKVLFIPDFATALLLLQTLGEKTPVSGLEWCPPVILSAAKDLFVRRARPFA